MNLADRPEATIHQAIEFLRAHGLVQTGEPVVVLSDLLTGDFDTEAILLRKA